MIPKSEWVWYGYAGHLMVSKQCAFHLCTRIGDYLVSTVGAYYPHVGSEMQPIGSDPDDYFETMIFQCNGEDEYGNPNITNNYEEVRRVPYVSSIKAELGHRQVCEDVSNGLVASPSPAQELSGDSHPT